MKILSIDWDFFFPEIHGFDWGHDEDNEICLDWIWSTRYNNRNLITGDIARYIKPDYKDFWEKIKTNNSIDRLAITDSHVEILKFVKDGATVWNLDQHHDCGYTSKPMDDDDIHCGNWALTPWIKNYNLIYPKWRLKHKEPQPKRKNIEVFYSDGFYLFAEKFDVCFICRSSAWTPAWCDHDWMRFLDGLATSFPKAWDRKIVAEWVMKPRPFDEKLAVKMMGLINEN